MTLQSYIQPIVDHWWLKRRFLIFQESLRVCYFFVCVGGSSNNYSKLRLNYCSRLLSFHLSWGKSISKWNDIDNIKHYIHQRFENCNMFLNENPNEYIGAFKDQLLEAFPVKSSPSYNAFGVSIFSLSWKLKMSIKMQIVSILSKF